MAMCVAFVIVVSTIAMPKRLKFSYSIETSNFTPGHKVRINVSAENVGRDFKYVGSGAHAAHLFIDINGERYYIYADDVLGTADSTKYEWESGEILSRRYTFNIPIEAPIGRYSLHAWCEGEEKIFKDVLEIS
jgi:hypothetical protein